MSLSFNLPPFLLKWPWKGAAETKCVDEMASTGWGERLPGFDEHRRLYFREIEETLPKPFWKMVIHRG